MNPLNPLKKSVPVLLLTFMALAVLPACSSTEEEGPLPGESGSSACGCDEGNLDCKDQCFHDLDF